MLARAPWARALVLLVAVASCRRTGGPPRAAPRVVGGAVAPETPAARPTDGGHAASDARLIAGMSHTCALNSTDDVYCWGQNDAGQLGVADRSPRAEPSRVEGFDRARSLSAGYLHTCALRADGTVWCWGGGPNRALPAPDGAPWGVARVPLPGPAARVASGGFYNCALLRDRSVWCWSQLREGLGPRRAQLPEALARVQGLPEVQAIAVGDAHVCALDLSGGVLCWGSHQLGRLLDPALPAAGVSAPTRISGLPEFVGLWAGGAHTCGQTRDGALRCWGGLYTLHGVAPQWDRPGPLVTPREGPVTRVSVGSGESCAVQGEGVVCWRVAHDLNESGLIPSPFDAVVLPGVGDVVALAAGEEHGCARSADGRVRCWGDREDQPFHGGEAARRTQVRELPAF